MENILGKALVFTDLHIGLKSASKSRLSICISVIKEIVLYVLKNGIKNIIFCGDWNHVRVSTENNVLNVSYKLMSALAKVADVYLIVGNHDIYLKNSVDINSLIVFKDIKNVHIIDKVEHISINGNKTLLVPWLGDVSGESKEEYDMMFGHFDVSHKYLVKSYIEDHSSKVKASNSLAHDINQDNLLMSEDTVQKTAGDFIGDFVDVVKTNGVIFSGHIHGHRDFLAKKRNFIFVGSPYQLNLGEKDYLCGFYVVNEDNSYSFHEITTTPKHILLKMSEVVDNFETYDFSIVKGNIILKIYDVEVDRVIDAKVCQKINDFQPYEELIPEYDVDVFLNSDLSVLNESIELIKKSKLEYVKNYIKNIDPEVLKSQDINSDKLYEVLKEYYEHVTDE